MQIGAATMENSMEGPQKTKNALWPSKSTSEYIYKENQNASLKKYMHPYVYCNIISNS